MNVQTLQLASTPAPSDPVTKTGLPVEDPPSRHPLEPVFQAGTLRARCAQVLQSVDKGLSAHYVLDREALAALARQVTRQVADSLASPAAAAAPADAWQAYPWPQLRAAGIDAQAELAALLAGKNAADQARAWAELGLVSVLMGTDIGPRWRYNPWQTLQAAAFVHAAPDELLALLDRSAPRLPPAVTAAPAAQPAADGPDAGMAPSAPGDAATAAPAAPAAPPAQAPATATATHSASTAPQLGGLEGLAVAAYKAFVAGAFSSDPSDPCRVDAAALRHLDVSALRAMLQGTPTNPIPALEGRARLLAGLGKALQDRARPAPSAAAAPAAALRASSLLDDLAELEGGKPGAAPGCKPAAALGGEPGAGPDGDTSPVQPPIPAEGLLYTLLLRLAPAWSAGSTVQGLPAGDVWPHLWSGDLCTTGRDLGTGGWVPLHAQGLKLVAALAGPLQQAGCAITGMQALPACTDLATSALMMRAQVLVPRQPRLLQRSLRPGDEAVVECRAAAVALLDELAALVQQELDPQRPQPQGGPALSMPALLQATQAVLAGSHAQALRVEGDGALL